MSKSSSKKKVVKTATKTKAKPTVVKTKSRRSAPMATQQRTPAPLIFSKMNYLISLGGILLIGLGLLLMSGGQQTDPAVWNADEIYSTRRTLLAPLVIVLGLVVQIVAIFWKDKTTANDPAGLDA